MNNSIVALIIILGFSIAPAFAGDINKGFDSYDAKKIDKNEDVDMKEKTPYENLEKREIRKKVIGLVYRKVQNPV